MKSRLEQWKLLLKAGIIADATSMGSPNSTKNATKTSDLEVRYRKNGKRWYFGMKVHVGADPCGVIQANTRIDAATATSLSCLAGCMAKRLRSKAYYNTEGNQQLKLSDGRYLVKKSGKRSDRWDAGNPPGRRFA